MKFDFIVVGSGFGGSVTAMRLSQKGYRVLILEEGFKADPSNFPKTNWDVRKFLWAPLIRCFGIQRITLLNKIMVLHGAGEGGGSLVYANTLMQPEDKIFESSGWPKGRDWAEELRPHYEMGKKMLGVATNPYLAPHDLAIQELGKEMNVAHTFHATEVGIFFGTPDQRVADPYFSGEGPDRVGCNFCGSCMIGCPNGAKNTLDKNYLYFAKKWGAEMLSGHRCGKIEPMDGGGYRVHATSSRRGWGLSTPSVTLEAKQVILAAGALGSVEILLRNRDEFKTLPKVSSRLGWDVRSNGECLLGATTFDSSVDYSSGVAIGAAIHPDEHTKIEGVRYPAKSDLLRFMAVPLTENGGPWIRPLKLIGQIFSRFPSFLRLVFVRDWAKSTIVLLVMQSIDSKLRLRLGRSWIRGFRKGLVGGAQEGEIPSFIPVAQTAAKKLAKIINGVPQNIFSEVVLRTPATAHILGGARMGNSEQDGVIDDQHQVFHYPGLYVCDGSSIPSNLAVNPSLTITALAEKMVAQFPLNPTHEGDLPPTLKFGVSTSSLRSGL